MKLTAFATTALIAALSLPACVISAGDSTLTVENDSSYAIHQVYIAEQDTPDWGEELLDGAILYPGENLEIFDIECGTYDVLVYDELDASCELNGISLCYDDAHWIIDDRVLIDCDIFKWQ